MNTKMNFGKTHKALHLFLLLILLFSTFGTSHMTSVHAEGIQIPDNEELGRLVKIDLEGFGQPLPPGYSIVVDNNNRKNNWMVIAYYFRSESGITGNESLGIGKLANAQWSIISPANPMFNEWLSALPSSLLSEDAKLFFRIPEEAAIESTAEATINAYSGHRLPWQGGISYQVKTGVGGHSNPVEFWAYDFGLPNGTEIWASYSGTVAYVTQQYGPGACDQNLASQGNRVVVNNDDGSASLYLHLQQNGARVSVGQRVNRGDLIGFSGNSGYVCPTGAGYHLHFQVQLQGSSWWTQSQQVIFDPNGEPTAGTSPVSGNYRSPVVGPSGYTFCANEGGFCSFSGTADVAYGANGRFNYRYSIANGINCDNNTFGDPISGTPKACYYKPTSTPPSCNPNSDQIVLYEHPNYSGTCKVLGIGDYANPGAMGFSNDSASSIKVGSTVKAILYENDNYVGVSEEFTADDTDFGNNAIGHDRVSSVKVQLRGCNPNSNQIALYAGTSYTGACVTLGIGDYSNPGPLDPVGNDNAESIRVGSNVQSVLCEHDNYQGRCSTLSSDEINLGTQTIGGNSVSSVKVQTRVPVMPALISPVFSQAFDEGQSITLSWSATGSEYYGEIWGGPAGTTPFDWQTGTSRNIGSQWAGYVYSWRVKARNSSGESPWSSTGLFMVRPASPSNLNASVISCSQINLSWTDNSGIEEGYRVYRNGNVIATLSAGSTSYQDTGLSASTPYSYQVTAHRVGGVESNFSNTAPATTPSCNVTPPSLLTPTNGAIIDEGQTIALSWTATGNEYFGEITGGPGGTLTFGWQTGTSKNIGSQWAGYDYSWRVKARNGSTESVWSSIRTFRVRPGMPGNLSASAISCSQINLSWSDNSGNEEGYRVYRNGVPIATLPSNSNSYQNTGLSASTPYSYTVKAYRGSIESSSSNTASATTSPCPFPPSANFDAFPTSGDSPLDVEFHIADTTGITTCTWDYGDGTPHGSSCDSIHPHRYTNPGRYTVTFTASGPGGSDSRTLTDYIVVNGSCLPVNLLKNPSVEADTNNDSKPDLWSTNAKFTRSSETTPKQGSYVGRFRAADNSGATITQTVPNLTAGTTYDFSAWVNIPPQGDTTFTFKLQVQWKNASNGNISTTLVKNYTTVTNGWNEATVDLVAPPGTASAVVKMVASSLNGTIYVDDFFFGTIDCPQTIPDLVIGSITPLPVNPQIGQAVSFAVVINNQGTADAASFYVDLYIDNPLPSSCGGVGQIYQYVAGLAAGASQTITLPYSGFSVDGSHTVNGLIDTDCVIDEDNDTNNSKSITLTVGNLIFANSFEDDDCFVTQWTSCVDDSGDLQFTDPPAPLKDNASMMITVDDNNLVYVASDHPDAERRYRARFYFDPNSISMVSGNAHFILYGYNGTSKVVLRVEFRNSSGSYQLRAGLLNDASNWTNSSWFTITDAPHFIEFDWRAASVAGANNGGLTLWIDGVQKANLAAVDNDTWRMDRVRLGAVNGIDAGTRGTYFFDAFASGRETYIGP